MLNKHIDGFKIVNRDTVEVVPYTFHLPKHLDIKCYMKSTKSTHKIFSERDCHLKNACSECKYLTGIYDSGNLPLIEDTFLRNRETGQEILFSTATKDIKVSRFPVTVCEPPPQSIHFIKGFLEDVP